MTPNQHPDQEIKTALIKIRLFYSRNEAFFAKKNTLLFSFRAGIRLGPKEVNELLSRGIITDLLNIENTRRRGVLIQQAPAENHYASSPALTGNYILHTLSYFNTAVPLANTIMENFWLKGHALADHKNGAIYLCSLNKA